MGSNAFNLLLENDDGWSQPVSKNKKKSKKKENTPTVAQASQSEEIPASLVEDTDFQVVKRGKQPKQQTTTATQNGTSHPKVTAESLEKSAIAATDPSSKTALLLQWQAHCSDSTFISELSKSQAVEKLAESLATAASSKDSAPLAALLSAVAHPSMPSSLAPSIATLIINSGTLAPKDAMAPRPQASTAAAALVTFIKAPLPSSTENQKSSSGKHALEEIQAQLASLESLIERAATTKEQLRVSSQLAEAATRGVDVGLGGGGAASNPTAAAALQSLETLKSALTSRQQYLSKNGGEGQKNPEEEISAVQRAHSREDSNLASQQTEAEAQIADVERQLGGLREKVQQIKAKRTAAQQLADQTVAGLKQGAKASAENIAQIIASVDAALNSTVQLDSALQAVVNGKASSKSGEDDKLIKEWKESGLAGRYAAATVAHLESTVKYLKEIGSKTQFYRQRLEISGKQENHLAMLNDHKAIADHKKQRQSMEKSLSDALNAVIEAERSAQAVLGAWKSRIARIRRQAGTAAGTTETAKQIDALSAEISVLAENATTGRQSNGPSSSSSTPPPPQKGAEKQEKQNSRSSSTATAKETVDSVSISEVSGRTTPCTGNSNSAARASELAVLEQRLAELEAENKRKDDQIAAMMAAASVDIPSPAPPSKSAWGAVGGTK